MSLPDLAGWAIFAKVAETGSFARAAEALQLSRPTVSKAIGRLEARLGVPLLHRSSRRLALTDSGRDVLERARRILAEGEAAEAEAGARAEAVRGRVRIALPMSFGLLHVAPLLPDLLARHDALQLDLVLSDAETDLVADGIDIALRIAALTDSAVRARRLCAVRRPLVAAPAYLDRAGRPGDPVDLPRMTALTYTNLKSPNVWRLQKADGAGDAPAVHVVELASRLAANNADALMPALRAGAGIAAQPEFLVWQDLRDGMLEEVLPGWRLPDIALHLLTPPGRRRPAGVQAVIDHLTRHLSRAPWAR